MIYKSVKLRVPDFSKDFNLFILFCIFFDLNRSDYENTLHSPKTPLLSVGSAGDDGNEYIPMTPTDHYKDPFIPTTSTPSSPHFSYNGLEAVV